MGEKNHERFGDEIIVDGVTIQVVVIRRDKHDLLKATPLSKVWEAVGYVGTQPVYARAPSRQLALSRLKTAMETALGL